MDDTDILPNRIQDLTSEDAPELIFGFRSLVVCLDEMKVVGWVWKSWGDENRRDSMRVNLRRNCKQLDSRKDSELRLTRSTSFVA